MARSKNPFREKGLKFRKIIVSDDGRINSSDELLIVQAIIFSEVNIKAVANIFSITEELVSEIYMKYYIQINRSLNKAIEEDKLNKSLNDSIAILSSHISEIKTQQRKSGNKTLNTPLLSSATRSIDRLISLKGISTNEFKAVDNIHNTLQKQKSVEKLESGVIENNSDYLENQQAVFNMLNNSKSKKSVKITNIKDNSIKIFESIRECANFLNSDPNYISKINGKVYNDTWLIEKEE